MSSRTKITCLLCDGEWATVPELQADAENGNVEAQFVLGESYLIGDHGLMKSADLAIKWHRKAAEQGFGFSQHQLGFIYSKGLGVPADAAEAEKWYRMASEQSDKTVEDAPGPKPLAESVGVTTSSSKEPPIPTEQGMDFTTFEPLVHTFWACL